MAGLDGSFDLQLLSQCGSAECYQSPSVLEIGTACCVDVSPLALVVFARERGREIERMIGKRRDEEKVCVCVCVCVCVKKRE